MVTEIKGKFGEAINPFVFRLRGLATIAALVADRMRAFSSKCTPSFEGIHKILCGYIYDCSGHLFA